MAADRGGDRRGFGGVGTLESPLPAEGFQGIAEEAEHIEFAEDDRLARGSPPSQRPRFAPACSGNALFIDREPMSTRWGSDAVGVHSYASAIVSATNAGRVCPSISISLAKVMRTPPATSSTFNNFWRSRTRDPDGTGAVNRTRSEP